MISEKIYQEYCANLLQGKKETCARIVVDLLDSDIEICELYSQLFQKSLYHVGELWEKNKITVAREHLISAISEGLLHLVFPRICAKKAMSNDKVVVISCSPNEYHQIGGKMIADIFELHGWDSDFLGANTPMGELLEYIDNVKPDIVGLSLSVYFNISTLQKSVRAIHNNFSKLDILVGGQAFRWSGIDHFKDFPRVNYIASVEDLDHNLGSSLHA